MLVVKVNPNFGRWLTRCGLFISLVANSVSSPAVLAAPVPSSEFSIGADQFALEQQANPKIGLNVTWKSEEALETPEFGKRTKRELRLFSFYESGMGGDKSFDLDRAIFRIPVASGPSAGYVWFGRSHPVEEGAEFGPVQTTGAIGANWVQNQSDALNPRASGWIGAGFSDSIQGFSVNAVITPLFLPSFGPRLDLSESDNASGSRYARLPPQFVNSKRALVAIRYKVDPGELKNIVLQHQFYVGVSKQTRLGDFRLLGWSAPAPNPELNLSDMIRVNSEDADALVTVVPRFPRQNFVGLQWALQDSLHNKLPLILLESAYELNSANLKLSATFSPVRSLKFGALQSTSLRNKMQAENPALEISDYAQDLVWTELASSFYRDRIRTALRWEQHLTSDHHGAWVRPRIEYAPQQRLRVFAQANMLAGQKGSYFGEWRSLDSVNSGVRYLW